MQKITCCKFKGLATRDSWTGGFGKTNSELWAFVCGFEWQAFCHDVLWFCSGRLLQGSVGRHHIGRDGHVSCITTTVKLYDFASKSLLSGEVQRYNWVGSGNRFVSEPP
jgi:hypothetical protein